LARACQAGPRLEALNHGNVAQPEAAPAWCQASSVLTGHLEQDDFL